MREIQTEDTIEQEAFALGSQQGAGFWQEAVKGTACGHSLSKGPSLESRLGPSK